MVLNSDDGYSILRVHKSILNYMKCGEYSEEDPPVPIPNTVVKLLSADDTWGGDPLGN